MNDLSTTIADSLVRCYEDFAGRVRTLSEPLSEEQFWTKPYAYGNSVGNLALHVTGNLSYYVGARIAETGYARERPREFATDRDEPKADVLRKLDEAVAVVVAALRAETPESWGTPYTAVGLEDAAGRFDVYLRCAAHFQHHVGQMLYLVAALGDRETSA